jgi:hypothetical protein
MKLGHCKNYKLVVAHHFNTLSTQFRLAVNNRPNFSLSSVLPVRSTSSHFIYFDPFRHFTSSFRISNIEVVSNIFMRATRYAYCLP